jgi:hypothetical protein
MGQEAQIEYASGRLRAKVRAHLDSQALQLSGDKKLKLPLTLISTATVDGDQLKITAPGESFTLSLGAKDAATWARKILNPPSLADKLGLKAGKSVTLIGLMPPEIATATKAAKPSKAIPKAFAADINIVSLPPGKEDALIVAASRALAPAQALWFIYEKGQPFNGDNLIAAARKARLKDTKVARISDTHAGLRFIK